ncbi:hypothetical protein LTS17_010290 [Exophiala oligosperma]
MTGRPGRQHSQQQTAGSKPGRDKSNPLTQNGQERTAESHRSANGNASEKVVTPTNVKIVDWDGPDDRMNPKNMSSAKKWLVVSTLATGSACVTATSSIYTTTYEKMDPEFGSSRIVATLGLSLFVVGLGLSPMLLGPLSEFYGRRPIYILAFAFFTIWLIPCAVAQNIQTMLIARFFNGFSGAAFLSVAGGSVGDLFKKEKLQAPMTVYSASPFTGPCLGPIIGGFINYYTSWRWTYYMLLIWAGVVTMLIIFSVPETYAPVLLRNKARKRRSDTGDQSWHANIEIMQGSICRTILTSLWRPFMLLFLDPMCFCLCLFSAILLGVLYLFFGAFALVFEGVYGFNLWQVGLSFLGILVGMLIAVGTLPIWHHLYLHQVAKHQKQTGEANPMPEFRLPSSVIGSWFCVIGLFWFGWTIYPSIHWIVPVIGTAFFGFGVILPYVGIFTYLVDG